VKIATESQRPSTAIDGELHEAWIDEKSSMSPEGFDLLDRRRAVDGQELEEFLHDFVIQDLVALSLNLELLVNRANSLIGRIRGVVDGRNEERTLESVISIASASFDGLATCAIHVHPASNMLLDRTLLVDVSCVIRECVSNAVRHGRAAQVKISAHTTNDVLELTVEDDGVGIDDHSNFTGNGTRNIAARARRRGGSCYFVRLPDGGTKVTWTASIKETQS
jgi:glucose-6-phosphate-specific signal transduction histidine kinase